MTRRSFLFGCDETYFFRGGMPFTAGENPFLPSVFPPNPSVFQGVVRTALMNGHGVDFASYYQGRCNVCGVEASRCGVLAAVGHPGTTDGMQIELSSPYVTYSHGTAKLRRAPLDLLELQGGGQGGDARYVVLCPGDKPVETDRGPVSLPKVPNASEAVGEVTKAGTADRIRVKNMEDAWISEEGLLRYLRGETVLPSDVRQEADLLDKENRVGIARDRRARSTVEGMLYFIEHVRLGEGYGLGVDVSGVPEGPLPVMVKLGGEGRLSSLQTTQAKAIPSQGVAEAIDSGPGLFGRRGFKLVLLSPARFGSDDFLPGGFETVEEQGFVAHRGVLAGIECTLVSIATDRAVRLGGWDMMRSQPKPRHSYLPAGTVFYFVTDHSGDEVVDALHDAKVGLDTSIGYGHTVVGRW